VWKEVGRPPWWDLWNQPEPPRATGREGFEPGILLYVAIAVAGVWFVWRGFDKPPREKISLMAQVTPAATATVTASATPKSSAPGATQVSQTCKVWLNNPADGAYLDEYAAMYPLCEIIPTWAE
jgi:hypothetical protein